MVKYNRLRSPGHCLYLGLLQDNHTHMELGEAHITGGYNTISNSFIITLLINEITISWIKVNLRCRQFQDNINCEMFAERK